MDTSLSAIKALRSATGVTLGDLNETALERVVKSAVERACQLNDRLEKTPEP